MAPSDESEDRYRWWLRPPPRPQRVADRWLAADWIFDDEVGDVPEHAFDMMASNIRSNGWWYTGFGTVSEPKVDPLDKFYPDAIKVKESDEKLPRLSANITIHSNVKYGFPERKISLFWRIFTHNFVRINI